MATHCYLGDDLLHLRSRNFLNEGEEYDLIILPLPNIVLFPYESLPLRISNKSYKAVIESSMRGNTNSSFKGLTSCHLGIINLTEKNIAVGDIGRWIGQVACSCSFRRSIYKS